MVFLFNWKPTYDSVEYKKANIVVMNENLKDMHYDAMGAVCALNMLISI